MYIVEIRHDGDGLAGPMAQFRTWLDRERVQPGAFRLSLIPGHTIFHVEFESANDAEAFAQAFAGQVIWGERPGAVAAIGSGVWRGRAGRFLAGLKGSRTRRPVCDSRPARRLPQPADRRSVHRRPVMSLARYG